jgi:Ca2+-binding EF-hand superfamily protein
MGPVSAYSGAPANELQAPIQTGNSVQAVIQKIKDVLYTTRKSLHDIFKEVKLGSILDEHSFVDYFKKIRSDISPQDIVAAFKQVSNDRGQMTFEQFSHAFQWQVPSGQNFETEAIRRVREWMFKKGFSSDTSFEFLCKQAGKQREQQLSLFDFHKAVLGAGLGFSAPEIDVLFSTLDFSNSGSLTLDGWKARVYEDSSNPLQLLREIIANNNLTSDDLLDKMKLRVWDEDMDYQSFSQAMRKLDPTLADPQMRYLAKALKSNNGKIQVTGLLRNLCGHETETVDFRNKLLRQIYDCVYPNKEAKLI